MFSQACVKNSVHREGGCIPACTGQGFVHPSMHRGVSAQAGGLPGGCTLPSGPEADTPPPRRPLQQMVRILLECILLVS